MLIIYHMYDGFVYIWFDSHRRKFYIGSHQGTTDDGYVGSGKLFTRAYNKRPTSFKRRIIEYVTGNLRTIHEREQYWLGFIKPSELGDRYYNIKKQASGGSASGAKRQPCSEITKQKIAQSNSGKVKNEDHRKKLSASKARIYRFTHSNTGEAFVGTIRDFAINHFSIAKRASIANAACASKRYGNWCIDG